MQYIKIPGQLADGSWRDAKEMSEMLDSLIKEMVLVGVEENQFVTSCSYAIDNYLNKFQVTKGKLIHSVFCRISISWRMDDTAICRNPYK